MRYRMACAGREFSGTSFLPQAKCSSRQEMAKLVPIAALKSTLKPSRKQPLAQLYIFT